MAAMRKSGAAQIKVQSGNTVLNLSLSRTMRLAMALENHFVVTCPIVQSAWEMIGKQLANFVAMRDASEERMRQTYHTYHRAHGGNCSTVFSKLEFIYLLGRDS